jgi:hypothetical protein
MSNNKELNLHIIRSALDTHLRELQSRQDDYAKNNNPEGAEIMRKQWHVVYAQREIVNAVIREKGVKIAAL